MPFYMKIHDQSGYYEPVISDTPIEVNTMMNYLFGTPGQIIYTIFAFITFELMLAAHITVFASSFTQYIPIFDLCNVYESDGIFNECRNKYLFYGGVYLCIVITLTQIGLGEQKLIQVLSTILRLLIFILMFITAILAIATDTPL